MWGRLFKKTTELAEYAGEVLAPSNRTKIERFQQNWARIPELVSDQSVFETDDEETSVFELLADMLDILIEEETETEGMGPCMEFMLEKNVLRTMVSVGQTGFPKGIMREILKFFTHLLTDIKEMALIPHQNVYNPIKVLLKVFTKSVKANQQDALVAYLDALCIKLAQQPYLSELFTETETTKKDPSTSKVVFLPLSVLENLLKIDDDDIRLKSMACLKTIVGLQTPTINTILLETRIASTFMCMLLTTSFKALAPHMDDDESMQDAQMHLINYITEPFPGWKRFSPQKLIDSSAPSLAFLSFMDYIHFCNDVTKDCDKKVAEQITKTIRIKLLEELMGPMVEQLAEDEACTATSYITACVTQISSPALLHEFTRFLFGAADDESTEDAITNTDNSTTIPPTTTTPTTAPLPPTTTTTTPEAETTATDTPPTRATTTPTPTPRAPNNVATLLIQRCDDISDDLSAATLQLFLRMLMKRDERILRVLVLNYIDNRNDDDDDDGNDDTDGNNNGDGDDATAKITSPINMNALRTVMNCQAERILDQLPDHLRTDDDDNSYKVYFSDAQKEIWKAQRTSQRWNPPSNPTNADTDRIEGNDDDDGPDFSVGPADDEPVDEEQVEKSEQDILDEWRGVKCTSPFLEAVIRRLSQLPTQSYSLNLIVTATVSTLLEYPNPVLHSILLASENSLPSTVSQLCAELKAKSNRIDNIEDRLRGERQMLTMLGEEDVARDATVPMAKTLQAIIVLEEFGKELAARLLVQTNELLLDVGV